MVIHKHARFFSIICLLIAFVVLVPLTTKPSSAVDFCTTAKCKEALAAEQAATAAMASANSAANSAEEEVARLQAENAQLTATINKNLLIAEELRQEIEANQQKLDQQQAALATLLVDMHFESNTSTLMLLAGSQTISDLAERQTRKDTVKTQVALASQDIKELKNKLEDQKSQIDAIIAAQKSQLAQIQQNEARQKWLLAKYKNDAKGYAADAEAARRIKEDEIAAEIARLNSSGSAAAVAGIDTYPWRNNCPGDNLKYSTGSSYGGSWGYVCQCVSYTGWKAFERWGARISGWGNASTWHTRARAAGKRVDHTPAAYTVAVYPKGTYGHVMWVESVNSDGTINVSEYNNTYATYLVTGKNGVKGAYGYRSHVRIDNDYYFIHFN